MDTKVKAEWVAALRSGGYKQGEGFLRMGDSYCCLGVLCDIAGSGEWISEPAEWEPEDVFQFLPGNFQSSVQAEQQVLPYSLVQNLELPDSQVDLDLAQRNNDSVGPLNLTTLNDDGFTFDQIADVIDYFL
jgi:hypothetical protein